MKKVFQTKYTRKDGKLTGDVGDCWRACIASFLHLDSEEVPHYMEMCIDEESPDLKAGAMFNDFMRNHGFYILVFDVIYYQKEELEKFIKSIGDAPFFAIGKSFKGDWLHQVIYKNGELWHDPNGTGKGIEDIQIIEIPILIDPRSQK